MARTKQTARKSNKGLPKATKGEQGRKGGRGGGNGINSGGSGGGSSGISSGRSGGGSSGGRGGAKGKVPSGRFSQQLENRPPTAAPKRKKPYVHAFQKMQKLQCTTKLCISKYQMARYVFLSLNLVLQCRNMIDVGFVHCTCI